MAAEMFQRFSFSSDEDIIARTRWYIHFRWFYIYAIATPAGLSMYLAHGWGEALKIILSAAAIALVSNGFFYMAAHTIKQGYQFQALAAVLLLTDIMITNYLISTRGGIEARGVILYVIPIIMSAILFARKGIYAVAALCLVSYSAILAADYLNVYRSSGGLNPELHTRLPDFLYTMTFFTSALIAIAVVTDFIVKLLRQKERQALETIEDLKQAQAVGKFGSWEWDLASNQIVWSDEIYRSLGLSTERGSLSFERYLSFVHPKDRRRLTTEITKASKQPRRFGFDYRLVQPDGSVCHVRAEGQSLAARTGRVVTIIGTARDITEERMLDQSKNEFVSLASHQLRTPATVVKQYLNMLLDGYAGELSDKQRDFLKIASDTNDHQINIVNNLLGVAQLESGKIQLTMAQVDLVMLARTLVEEYAPRARNKDQVLSFSSRFKYLYSRADEHSLRTVVENILDNAFKYTMPGKAITIRLTKEANTAVISVADQGVGIASNDLAKLFKKFSRIENPETFQEEGAGLGLYWAEKIIALHGGRIAIESEPGRGTNVKVILPMRRKAKKTRSRPRRPAAPLRR